MASYFVNNGQYYRIYGEYSGLGNCCGAGTYYGVGVQLVSPNWSRYEWPNIQRVAKSVGTIRELVEQLTLRAINDMDCDRRALFVMVDAVDGERVQEGDEPVDLDSTDLHSGRVTSISTYYVMQMLLEWQKNKDKRLPSNFEISDMGTFINPNTNHELQAIQIVIRYDKEDRDYDDEYYDDEDEY